MTMIFRTALFSTLFALLAVGQAQAAGEWNIKCFTARGQTYAVKAISAEGMTLDVKAIEAGNADLLDVKMIRPDTGETLPVKVLESSDEGASYSDVKAIEKGDQILPIKGITESGNFIGVKAFYNESSGEYDIKCLSSGGQRLALKAISPKGRVFDVKGMKDLPGQEELAIEVQAHIKARPQR